MPTLSVKIEAVREGRKIEKQGFSLWAKTRGTSIQVFRDVDLQCQILWHFDRCWEQLHKNLQQLCTPYSCSSRHLQECKGLRN